MEEARRKALQTSVAALCVEVGYMSTEKDALSALSEILQSYITELGRTARVYCELSSRTEPTVSDVHLALVDSGVTISSLPEYSRRPLRRHVPKQPKSFPQPQPRSLQVGTKAQRPPHIAPHLPSFPDPHTYIKTPMFVSPVSDYKSVREKLASQKRNTRRGLSTLLAKIRPSRPIAGETDAFGCYTVVSCPTPTAPLYQQALMPTVEDQVDVTTEITANQEELSAESGQSNSQEGNSSSSQPEPSAAVGGISDLSMQTSPERYENPFLKPAKKIKLRLL